MQADHDQVQSWIDERRESWTAGQRKQPRWGLALSGGGIRSATFCFGLLKALARNRTLGRFDLMSTVSGGGYIGAMLGKLHHDSARQAVPGQEDLETAVATADKRWFAWWLRANGRYLIPRGTKDLLFAASTFGRNLLGVHVELAMMALAIGLALVVVDLALWGTYDLATATAPPGTLGDSWIAFVARWPTLWLFLPIPAWLGILFASAYWMLPNDGRTTLGSRRWLSVGVAVLVMLLAGFRGETLTAIGMPRPGLVAILFVLSGCTAGAVLAWRLDVATATDRARSRNRLTRWLSMALMRALVLVLLGGIDFLAWHLATTAKDQQGPVALAVIAIGVVLRMVLPKVAEQPRALSPVLRRWMGGIYNLAGLLALAALLVVWVSIVHRLVTAPLFMGLLGADADYRHPFMWLVLLAAPIAAVMLLSAPNMEFLNRSSLHAFYRSRLMRSYLGAANGARFGEGIEATHPLPANQRPASLRDVGEVDSGDDVAMHEYAPHARGGPAHLVNVCVNQTRDPRGGLFNQDRKGLLLTVGPGGWMRVAQDPWQPLAPDQALTLSSWMAISGAAFSPGLGSSTRPGIAALATMAGIRLGYWWQREPPGGKEDRIGKYRQLVSELLGRFDGDGRRSWFLSDGGHYENTAAYALLRERCRTIVVADCGADPRYAFGDLENLVRRARIDLGAEITFLKPRKKLESDPWKGFGSLNDIASADSTACLALARVQYAEIEEPAYLVVVKPSMCAGLPADLVNFKADNPDFPQEPTTDQFFAEAQWESYYQLGTVLGTSLTPQLLNELAAVEKRDFVLDDGVPTHQAEAGATSAAAAGASPVRRLHARILATGAVTASISLGAIGSLLLGAWQAVDAELKQRAGTEADRATVKELSDLYAKYLINKDPGNGRRESVIHVAGALVNAGQAICRTPRGGEPYQDLPLIKAMLPQIRRECAEADVAEVWACKELRGEDLGSAGCLRKPDRVACEQRYWVRDYEGSDLNCRERWPSPWRDPIDPRAQVAVGPATPASAPASAAASAPVAPVVPVTAASAPRKQTTCAGHTVYIQIYGPDMRDTARSLREPWRNLGASVPPIEDVWHSATQAGRNRPAPMAGPTLIVHEPESGACANALLAEGAKLLPRSWSVQPLPARLRAQHGVIEAWIPSDSR